MLISPLYQFMGEWVCSLASSKDNQWSSSPPHPPMYHCELMDLNIVDIFQYTEVVIINGQIISYLFDHWDSLLNPLGTTPIVTLTSFPFHTKRPSRLILYISCSRYFLCIFLWAGFLLVENVSRDYKQGILVLFQKYFEILLLNIYKIVQSSGY